MSTTTSPRSACGAVNDATCARAAARADRSADSPSSPLAAKVATSREIVAVEATGPNNPDPARKSVTSAGQSPPTASITARSKTTLPGSWTAVGFRHRDNCSPSAADSPTVRAVSTSTWAPASDTHPLASARTWTREPDPILFTYGVPSAQDCL